MPFRMMFMGMALANIFAAAAESVPEAIAAATVRPKSARPDAEASPARAAAGAPRADHQMCSQSRRARG